ncbi:TPA: hypothetical protein I9088_001021 [Clostridium perfringens]|nr:hypothetical protein [Clostridium perfringens]
MGQGYRFEILFRNAMNCNRESEGLLTFGGIINAGVIENEGGLYDAAISVLASLYPRQTYANCRRLDSIIDSIGRYRSSDINSIPQEELDNLYNAMSNLILELNN